jgi:hypothetical protein
MPSQSVTERPVNLPPTDLRVYLLGPPKMEWDGHPFDLPRRQARALLYHLVVSLQPIPREHLYFVLVRSSRIHRPPQPEPSMTHLSRALPTSEILLTSSDHVGLDPHRTWLDTVAFGQWGAAQQQAMELYESSEIATASD